MGSPGRRALRSALLAFLAAAGSACVFLDTYDIGDACTSSLDCDEDIFCVLLDEAEPEGRQVCAPAVSLPETACTQALDCRVRGFPVDALCVEGACACIGETFLCAGGLQVDPHRCICVTAAALAG
jgi:hypothetical protein